MLSLNTITKAKGSAKKIKRVGRGNASGHGTYSTRGLKGQKSRSGVSNLKRLGMRKQLLQTPKFRGFRSLQPKNQVVSVKAINRFFKDNEVVTPAALFEKKLVSSATEPIKILGKEKLTVKVTFEKIKMSDGVKSQVK
jgi:large subunit ribosomal protein L15